MPPFAIVLCTLSFLSLLSSYLACHICVLDIKMYKVGHICLACHTCVLHTYENTSKPIFGKPFAKHFWKIFFIFENSLLGYSKSIFRKECPRG